MSRILWIFGVAPLLGVSMATACGGTVIGGEGAKDSGTPEAARDAGTQHHPDASPGVDVAAPDTATPTDSGPPGKDAVAPGATMLAPGKDFVLSGVTSDGFAVYSTATLSTTTVYAVSIDGGAPVEIDTLANQYSEVIVGGYTGNSPLVFVLNDMTSTGLGTLKTWSSKGGLHTIASNAYAYQFAVSKDLLHMAYLANFDPTAMTADAYAANVDGTGAALLQSGVAGLGNSSMCYAELAFVGQSVVLGSCAASTMTGNVYSFAQPSWAKTTVASGVYPYFNADPTGTNLLVVSTAGLEVIPVSGGSPTVIDSTGQNGFFTSDGASVVYVTSAGALARSSIKSPSPTVLVSGGLEGISGLSPDDSTALVFKHYDSATYLSDLYAASAVKGGALTTLSAATTAAVSSGNVYGVVYGRAFTGDSSHVLFYTGVSTTTYPYLGTLQSSAMGPSAPVTLALGSNIDWTSGKTVAVFEDSFVLPPGSLVATIDVKYVDTASGGSPKLVVSQANAGAYYGSFFLSPDGARVVYAQNAGGGGVFVTPLP